MAENESMEGKDFALQEKKKARFEEMIQQAIANMDEEEITINSEIEGIMIKIQKKDSNYTLSLLGENIADIKKDGNFSYNIKGLESIKEKLEKEQEGRPAAYYNDLGLPDIEFLKYLEKEKNKKIQEEREVEKKNDDKSDEEKEENEVEQDEEKDEEEKDNKKSQLTRGKNWVKLDLNMEITRGMTLRQLLDCKSEEAYVVPGKDIYEYSIVEGDEKSGYKKLDTLEKTEGRAPKQQIISIDNKRRNGCKRETGTFDV